MKTRKYNRLTFDRNQDGRTALYKVFRGTDPSVNRNSVHIMDIKNPDDINPVRVTEETVSRISTFQFRLRHKNVLPSTAETPMTVKVNGTEAYTAGYTFTIDERKGIVKFQQALETSASVTVSYWFDGIEVIDYDKPQALVIKYNGPIAQDYSTPSAPQNVQIFGDSDLNRAILKWEPGSPKGQYYHYRIEATDGEGRWSELSRVASAFMVDGHGIQGYAVERSYDRVMWEVIARTSDLTYSDYGIDRVMPNSVYGLTVTSSPDLSSGTSNVVIKWQNPTTDSVGQSAVYRIRVISQAGNWSNPSETAGPVYVKTKIDKIVIRRKEDDGAAPTFDGPDAITIAVIDDVTTTNITDITPIGSKWAYGVYRVDVGGNPSEVSWAVTS